MKDVSPAAAYAMLLPDLVEAGRRCGYAVAFHGSFGRDLDLIAVPWVEDAKAPEALILAILQATGGNVIISSRGNGEIKNGDEPTVRPHGRLAWSLHLGHSNLYLDVSVMPRVSQPQKT